MSDTKMYLGIDLDRCKEMDEGIWVGLMLAWVFQTKHWSVLSTLTGSTGDDTTSYDTGSASRVSLVCALGSWAKLKFCTNELTERNTP